MKSGRANGWYVPSLTVATDGRIAGALSVALIGTAVSLSLFSS
jgi:hypothetical protein